jgi:hypothetical protein
VKFPIVQKYHLKIRNSTNKIRYLGISDHDRDDAGTVPILHDPSNAKAPVVQSEFNPVPPLTIDPPEQPTSGSPFAEPPALQPTSDTA